MKIPEIFDDIRPIEPGEMQETFDRIMADSQFQQVLAFLYPGVPAEAIRAKMRQCNDNLEFQKAFVYGFLENLLAKASTGCDMDAANVDITKPYTFISNHRDIVLDSALLAKLMIDCGFKDTCEIGIGDNLLKLPWVKDIVRLNKAFIVLRDLQPSRKLRESIRLSQYMHFAIEENKHSIWLAQREGRAKDSNDLTQTATLKMMAKGGKGGNIENLINMHIVPLAISYEYDPCDFLKARELMMKRENTEYKKAPMEDVISMRTGIMGYKGHVHYQCAPCIDEYLRNLNTDMPQNELFTKIAQHVDREIHRNYRLYPGNYAAMDMLDGTDSTAHYTAEEKKTFENYINGQLAKIEADNRDDEFLRTQILNMYAWPARNYIKATTLEEKH